MCDKLGKIIPVQQANKEEEIKAHNRPPNFYCFYWRTNRGMIRKIGYVKICKCGNIQQWAQTKKELQ